jgi:hypothetical protein
MKLSAFLILALLSVSSAFADTELYFISPQDGDKISGEFTVSFGLRGMGVAPAGVEVANTGHHHLLIDVDALPPKDAPLPKTEQVRHFGGGQTETTLSLPPGQHTLQLLLGNYSHIPHSPPVMSSKITITVTE